MAKWFGLWIAGVLGFMFFALLGIAELFLLTVVVLYWASFETGVSKARRTIDAAALMCCVLTIAFVPPALMAYFELLFGWIAFACRVVPNVVVDPVTVLIGCTAIVGFAAGANVLTRRSPSLALDSSVRSEVQKQDAKLEAEIHETTNWSRWTIVVLLGALLMFISGLAAFGILESGRSIWELRK